MNKKYKVIIAAVLIIALISAGLYINKAIEEAKRISFDLGELIQKENPDDLTLKIYYISPYILTRVPLDVETLMGLENVKKITVGGKELQPYFELFGKINGEILKPVKEKNYMNVRMYYVLESKKNGRLFDVVLSDRYFEDVNVFFNGTEVKNNKIFYEVVLPFLPEDDAEEYRP